MLAVDKAANKAADKEESEPPVKKTKSGKKWLEPHEVEIGRLTKTTSDGGPRVTVAETNIFNISSRLKMRVTWVDENILESLNGW